MLKQAFLTLGLAAVVAPAMAAVEWTSDLDAATKKAAAENKALLLDFTGSDWCGWCIRLRKDVMDKPEFEAYIADKFVPVEIDVPQNPKFNKELRKRNEALCTQYNVHGFPTVMVLTTDGQVAGGFCGGRDSFEAVKPSLDTAVQNVAKLAAAKTQEGVEKASTLAEVYVSLGKDLQESAQDMRDTVVALDPEDKTGLRHGKAVEDDLKAALNKLRETENEKDAMAVITQLEGTVMPENRIHILRLKARVQMAVAETEADILAARDTALAAAAANPNAEEAAAEKTDIEKAFADPATMLKRVKEARAMQNAPRKKK